MVGKDVDQRVAERLPGGDPASLFHRPIPLDDPPRAVEDDHALVKALDHVTNEPITGPKGLVERPDLATLLRSRRPIAPNPIAVRNRSPTRRVSSTEAAGVSVGQTTAR